MLVCDRVELDTLAFHPHHPTLFCSHFHQHHHLQLRELDTTHTQHVVDSMPQVHNVSSTQRHASTTAHADNDNVHALTDVCRGCVVIYFTISLTNHLQRNASSAGLEVSPCMVGWWPIVCRLVDVDHVIY